MDEDHCRFCRILALLGLVLILLALSPVVGCFVPALFLHTIGCLLAGLGLLGEIGSLARSRPGPTHCPGDRYWLKSWPIVFRSLMLVGVTLVFLTVQLVPGSSDGASLDSSFWYRIHLVGLFFIVAGLFASAVTIAVRSRLLRDPRPLSGKYKRLGALLLLGLVLLAGWIVFSEKAPGPSYCQDSSDCDVLWDPSFRSADGFLACASRRYYAFWPISFYPICPLGPSSWMPQWQERHEICACQSNQCVINWGEFYR